MLTHMAAEHRLFEEYPVGEHWNRWAVFHSFSYKQNVKLFFYLDMYLSYT